MTTLWRSDEVRTTIDDRPVHIRAGAADEVVDLRHQILRQGLPRESAIFDGDAAPSSLHVVALCDSDGGTATPGRVVGCVTLHASRWEGEPAWQLRGMATADEFRGRGLGRELLRFVEASVRGGAAGPRLLWCNARVPAAGFYERLGWQVVSDVFDIPTAGPHVRMVKRLGADAATAPAAHAAPESPAGRE